MNLLKQVETLVRLGSINDPKICLTLIKKNPRQKYNHDIVLTENKIALWKAPSALLSSTLYKAYYIYNPILPYIKGDIYTSIYATSSETYKKIQLSSSLNGVLNVPGFFAYVQDGKLIDRQCLSTLAAFMKNSVSVLPTSARYKPFFADSTFFVTAARLRRIVGILKNFAM